MGDGAPPWLNQQHDIFEDRGDPAAYDFQIGDLTTDGNWHDLDLSAFVPSGTKAVLLRINLQDDAASSRFRIRKNGNTLAYNSNDFYTQVANVFFGAVAFVPCDQNRIIEYNADNLTWTAINIVILGWFN